MIYHDDTPSTGLNGVSRTQRGTLALPLLVYQEKYADRNEAMAKTYATNAYTIVEIARHFEVSPVTASRAVRAHAKGR